MKRREFITLLGGLAVAWPLACATKADDLPRIGIIQSFPNENFEALTEGLREAGYIDGQNVLMEERFHGRNLAGHGSQGARRDSALANTIVCSARCCRPLLTSNASGDDTSGDDDNNDGDSSRLV